MPPTALRILVIGELLPAMRDLLRRFWQRGWGSQHVRNLQEARDLLGTFDFDVVLASECLCDGRGYELAEPVAVHSRTLMVGVALSETRLWLPVVERGAHVLGKRGLNAQMLESELTSLLGAPARETVRRAALETFSKTKPWPEGSAPQRSTMMRRKYRDRGNLLMDR